MSKPRNDYQEKRFTYLATLVPVEQSVGLEIGACDLPTVPKGIGQCHHADFRTASDMAEMWNLDPQSVCDVEFIINRKQRISDQIHKRFDYIIACHVIEHVPDPIGYIKDLSNLLKDDGILFLAVPDKHETNDKNRPLTSLEHILMDYHDRAVYPSVEHIVEFHRSWLELNHGQSVPMMDAYHYAVNYIASGESDAHCHVWDADSFNDHFKMLTEHDMLGGLKIHSFEQTISGFNEFVAVFKKASN